MSIRKRSDVWTHFVGFSNSDAKCNICKKTISTKGGSTSNLRRHLKSTHPSVLFEQFRTEGEDGGSSASTADGSTASTSTPPPPAAAAAAASTIQGPVSGTGVYYQAMPAVGPDGKNVMKLIPVKKVNGNFVRTHFPPSRNVVLPAHASPVPSPQNKVPTLQPTADGRLFLKTLLDVDTVSSVKCQQKGPNALLQSSTNQVHVQESTQSIAQSTSMPPSVPLNNKAVIVPKSPQLPNTVNLPALQHGHYLQIPSNATVRTIPASALPSSIKNQICHSPNDSNPVQGLPMVLYVSPVSSLKLDQKVPCATNPSELPQTLGHPSTASVVKSPEESSRNSQGGTTLMKWVVEQRAGSNAPYLIPVMSPSMSSDILKAIKHMESSRISHPVANEQVSSDISKEAVTPEYDNALVMCNSKVYLVSKRKSEVTKDMIINAEGKMQPRKSAQSPTSASGPSTSNMSEKQDQQSPVNDNKLSNIIDLCDDEEETSTSSGRIIKPSDTVSEHDEDSNVIFVSYIPPKSSETETSKEVTETTSPTSCVKDADDTKLDTESMESGSEVTSSCVAEVDVSKCEAVQVNGAALEGKEALSEKLAAVCGQQTDVTEKQSFEENVPDQIYQPKSDSELRRTFGITSDLSVSLQKIEESKESLEQEGHPQSEKRLINKRTLDGIRKLIRDSKIETKIKQLIQTQMPKPEKTGKRKRLQTNGGKSGSDTISSIDVHLSALSNVLVECDYELQSASKMFQTCPATEKETASTSDATTNLHSSTSLVEPVQTHTAKCQSDSPDCCSGLRKTLPRSSKGCGRVCTACPCGTKVGGVAGNSAYKPREKPNPSSSINSSNSASSESNRDGTPVDEVMAGSVSCSTSCSSAFQNSGDKTTHGSQSQPATEICSSHSRCNQDKTSYKSTGSQLDTGTRKPNKLDEVNTFSSSVPHLSYSSYKIPSELYSSVLLEPEEIKRQERIKRLKDLLQEKEAALEKLRKSM
ncbi:ligand-dependent nuclear receptor-interacting factor 1 isoform X3 [Tachysurus fulvidraco]|uniref:ligand-dependent nuclear receptor-interacting factor 1 isoform X3 n=1 Tax=Tachysurus fulvidraco TaxID=1234273 RepID=UPI000F4D7B54|nr:ligand-dependent nuclear receptor-interacting factor 1 isoform X3 [Tachysurus fulvidraco]